jgi:hypothetical protein
MVKKTYIERLIQSPDERVNYPLTLYGNQNFWPLTRTSEFRIGVLALCKHQNFWPPARTSDFHSPNQGESKLDPNSFELVGNCRLSLGDVSYWDKTTPSIYTRGSWAIEFPSIQSINKLIYYLYSNPSTLFFNLHVVHPLIHDQGWRPRLAGRPRATRRRPCPDRVPPRRELRCFLC